MLNIPFENECPYFTYVEDTYKDMPIIAPYCIRKDESVSIADCKRCIKEGD